MRKAKLGAYSEHIFQLQRIRSNVPIIEACDNTVCINMNNLNRNCGKNLNFPEFQTFKKMAGSDYRYRGVWHIQLSEPQN